MINKTKWKPDTCACEITYAWDTSVEEKDRQHTLDSINPCVIHKDLGTNDEIFQAVTSENTFKNVSYDDACKALPELVPENFEFSYDKDRKLIITLKGIDDAKVETVSQALAAKDVVIAKKQNG